MVEFFTKIHQSYRKTAVTLLLQEHFTTIKKIFKTTANEQNRSDN